MPQRTEKLQLLVLGAANAGKTSLLRRYFKHTFRDGSRVPTLGSDFYVGRVRHERKTDNENGDELLGPIEVNLQMWDTPGRERFYFNRKIKKTDAASMEASFFRHADAFLLVYDMTSSTSFTQLLKWYADLLEICKTNPRPILIVANKLDLFLADQQRQQRDVVPRRVPQRHVMGLTGDFKGKDFRYEYRVSRKSEEIPAGSTSMKQRSNVDHHRRMEISAFLANRENWTTDGSYLESLINSEDGSFPDREMVLLWCMRNDLKHIEVSAATGDHVDEAINEVVQMALHARVSRRTSEAPPEIGIPSPQKEDDVATSKDSTKDECSIFRPLVQLLRQFQDRR